jgi:hypothetical protein
VVEAATAHVRTLTARIRLVNHQLKAVHHKLDELCDQLVPPEENASGQGCEQRDVVILRSMPGLGTIILAVLLAGAWQPLRRRDYHALRCLSGVAPVTRRSGKTCVVVRRYACNDDEHVFHGDDQHQGPYDQRQGAENGALAQIRCTISRIVDSTTIQTCSPLSSMNHNTTACQAAEP